MLFITPPPLIGLAISMFVGLLFGSFVTLASHRLPHRAPIVMGRSECPRCHTPLGFRDLFPLFSWLATRGACRHCHAKISMRYPLIEAAQALLFALVYLELGWGAEALVVAGLSVCLLVMIVTDLEYGIIPDPIQWALLALGFAYHFVRGDAFAEPLAGLLAGGALGLLLRYGYHMLRHRHGLGLGDVKFLAVAGLWVGPYGLPLFLFASGMLGILTALLWRSLGRGRIFPFGPSLALALGCCVLYSHSILFRGDFVQMFMGVLF
ncbi:MAG: prepilin peptidase [Alphaproteobacteria bacterium]|nr:prepilin peptidase [Alphaproteobacteria bacterium]